MPEATPDPVQGPAPQRAQDPAEDSAPDPAQDPRTSEPAESRSVAWSRLLRMGRPRWTRANALAGVLALLLGVAMVVQIRHTQTQGLSTMRESDLVNLLDDVSQRSTRLDGTISDLQRQRDALISGAGSSGAAVAQAQSRLDSLKILAGTAPATGSGIVVTVTDPAGKFGPTQVLEAIEELRDAGAEVIDVGGARVVASSYVGGAGADVTISGQHVQRPLTITAIGDAATLAAAVQIPGGVTDTVKRGGGTATVDQRQSVTISSLVAAPTLRYAVPVAPTATSSPSSGG